RRPIGRRVAFSPPSASDSAGRQRQQRRLRRLWAVSWPRRPPKPLAGWLTPRPASRAMIGGAGRLPDRATWLAGLAAQPLWCLAGGIICLQIAQQRGVVTVNWTRLNQLGRQFVQEAEVAAAAGAMAGRAGPSGGGGLLDRARAIFLAGPNACFGTTFCWRLLYWIWRLQREAMQAVRRLTSLRPATAACRHLSLYSRQAFRQPSLQELRRLSDRFGFSSSDDELTAYKELIGQLSASLTSLDRLENPMRSSTSTVASQPVPPRSCGQRASAADNPGNAWYWRCDLKDPAAAQDSSLPLAGKTLALKDTWLGVPMMNGSKLLEGFVPTEDATVVTRILAAGGRIVGKAVCEDMCFSCTRRGGSSSGCGYLVAKGLVDMAIGGDQGGSIRIPSAWCGIVGLKPTFGLVPYTGALSMMRGIDHLGPMARTAIAGLDGDGLDRRQPTDLRVDNYSESLRGDLSKYSFGLLVEGFHGVDEDVDEAVRQLAGKLASAGAKVSKVSVPLHSQSGAFYLPYLLHGFRATYLTDGALPLDDAYVDPDAVDAASTYFSCDNQHIVKVVMLMSEFLSSNYGLKHFSQAANWIRELRRCYDNALNSVDYLLMPTLPMRPPRLLDESASVVEVFNHGLGMIGNTAAFNASGHPAITLNCGRTAGGASAAHRRYAGGSATANCWTPRSASNSCAAAFLAYFAYLTYFTYLAYFAYLTTLPTWPTLPTLTYFTYLAYFAYLTYFTYLAYFAYLTYFTYLAYLPT
uniref:Amidase domain-containing protein n=1 Tax=Macrostomum lignano TaxID=282301 RepID=A0A1I8F4U8_9PLAT